MNQQDRPDYVKKKKFFSKLLTVYGRKPVLESLLTPGVEAYRLHLSDSNKPAPILDEIVQLAKSKNSEILYHSREALSRISKNKKQDQGVAVDLKLEGIHEFDEVVDTLEEPFEIIALDNITNPQNLGMIIRSVCASPATALLLPKKGCANLDSLVIKSSAGTLFKARIIRCDDLTSSLKTLAGKNADIVGLDLTATASIRNTPFKTNTVFVLGNETDGISSKVKSLCTRTVKIPMANGVESLNVAVTAALIAMRNVI